MNNIPPEIWAAVGGADECVHHACTWAQGCHEHINDAIAEHDIDDAKNWVVRHYVLKDERDAMVDQIRGSTEYVSWFPIRALSAPGPALKRPDCFDFALDFLGGPEDEILLAYIQALEAAAGMGIPDGGQR